MLLLVNTRTDGGPEEMAKIEKAKPEVHKTDVPCTRARDGTARPGM
jgi:hypothetical protein